MELETPRIGGGVEMQNKSMLDTYAPVLSRVPVNLGDSRLGPSDEYVWICGTGPSQNRYCVLLAARVTIDVR